MRNFTHISKVRNHVTYLMGYYTQKENTQNIYGHPLFVREGIVQNKSGEATDQLCIFRIIPSLSCPYFQRVKFMA